jgi:UDP-glucose 6-dehydrogenase
MDSRCHALDARDRREFDVDPNPEFLGQGSAITTFFLYPDQVLVGRNTDCVGQLMRDIYTPSSVACACHIPNLRRGLNLSRQHPHILQTSRNLLIHNVTIGPPR